MNEEQTEGVLLTATPETDSVNVRRNSTGEVGTRASSSWSNCQGKIIPHYLRTSTGSCHDFCKYGRRHTFESKGRNPTFPRYSGSPTSSGKGQNQVPSVGEKQKKSSVKRKTAANPQIGLYDRPKISEENAFSPMKTAKPIQESEINKHDGISHERSGSSESVIKCNFPSPSKEIDPLEGFRTIKQGALERIGSCDDTETTTQETPIFLKKTEASADSYKRKLSPHEVHLSMEPSSAEQRTQSAKKTLASSKTKVEKKAPSPVKKTISPGKPKTLHANRFDASAKPALPGKSNITFVKPESQLKPATGIAGRNFGKKIVKNIDLLKPHGKKILKSPLDSLSPQSPANHVSKSASPMKHAMKIEKSIYKTDEIREKTVLVNPTDNENTESTQSKSSSCQESPSPSSSLSLSSSSSVSCHEEEYPDSESVSSEVCEISSDDGGDRINIAAQNEDKKSRGKMAIIHSEYMDQIPYKLNFRKGKILNPLSDHGHSRRLRFRQGRRMSDSQSGEGEMGKINFKMKELTCGETNRPDPEGQAVVLRHQDVQDKKDTVILFNNVIEETASKLAETRKSKVKALVGAFETVISLQERKPSTPV